MAQIAKVNCDVPIKEEIEENTDSARELFLVKEEKEVLVPDEVMVSCENSVKEEIEEETESSDNISCRDSIKEEIEEETDSLESKKSFEMMEDSCHLNPETNMQSKNFGMSPAIEKPLHCYHFDYDLAKASKFRMHSNVIF